LGSKDISNSPVKNIKNAKIANNFDWDTEKSSVRLYFYYEAQKNSLRLCPISDIKLVVIFCPKSDTNAREKRYVGRLHLAPHGKKPQGSN
jgi:hypothetical protein